MQVYSTSDSLKVGTQYPNVGLFNSFFSIWKNEGLRGYFRGLDAFLPRVIFYGAAQLATYDAVKNRLLNWENGPSFLIRNGFIQHSICGVIAAICSVTVIQPFDFIAVRMQNQPIDPTTKKGVFYSSPLDCLLQVTRSEGIASIFKGYRANVVRFGPYTVLIFVFVEKFREIFKAYQ